MKTPASHLVDLGSISFYSDTNDIKNVFTDFLLNTSLKK